jgi:hypothetical protein
MFDHFLECGAVPVNPVNPQSDDEQQNLQPHIPMLNHGRSWSFTCADGDRTINWRDHAEFASGKI